MNTNTLSPELPVTRIPGGNCTEDLDGGKLHVVTDEGHAYSLPIVRGQRLVEEAAAKAAAADGATFWSQLDAVKRVLADLCNAVVDDDLADALKHRLALSFAKKKSGQRADFDALQNSAPSTASGSED